jgi:hypothetical protein
MHVTFIVKHLKEAPRGLRCKTTIIDKLPQANSIGTSVDLVVVFRTVSHSMQEAVALACSKAGVPMVTSSTSLWDAVDRAATAGVDLASWQKEGFWKGRVGSALLDEVEKIRGEVIKSGNRNHYTSSQKSARLVRLFVRLGGDKRQLGVRWTSVVSSFNNNRPGVLPLINESIAAGHDVYSRATSTLSYTVEPKEEDPSVLLEVLGQEKAESLAGYDVRWGPLEPEPEEKKKKVVPSGEFPSINNRVFLLLEKMRENGITEITVSDDGSVHMKWVEVVMVPTHVQREDLYEVSPSRMAKLDEQENN